MCQETERLKAAYAEDRRTTAAIYHTEIDKEQPKANPVGEHTEAKILWQTSPPPPCLAPTDTFFSTSSPKISYKLRTDRCRTVMCQADRRVWMQVYNPSPHDKARSYHMFCLKTRLNLAFARAAEPGQRLLLFPAASTAMQLHHKGCLSLVADTRHPSWTQAREKLAGQLRFEGSYSQKSFHTAQFNTHVANINLKDHSSPVQPCVPSVHHPDLTGVDFQGGAEEHVNVQRPHTRVCCRRRCAI